LTSRSWIVLVAQRLVLRTARTPLGRLWTLAYWGIARVVVTYLAWGDRGAAMYVRGGLGADDLLPGLSDVDVAVVLTPDPAGPGLARERARRRWQELHRALPLAGLLLDKKPRIYEDSDLGDFAGTSALTFGLNGPGEPASRRAGYFGQDASRDTIRMLERPGLHGATADWRLLAGPDRCPLEPARDSQLRRIAAWLELTYWWQWVFHVSIDPTGPRTAHLCVKLVAEPARIWLWLAHGERASGRADALARALRRMPEEEDALRRALHLHRLLPYSPAPPLTEVLPALVRLSARIAGLIGAQIEDAEGTEVRLAGADPPELVLAGGGSQPTVSLGAPAPRLLPLADWRSLACPLLPDESFTLLPGDPGDPTTLAAAASQPVGSYSALQADGLIVLPATRWSRTRLRAVKCPATDPVSFALAEGKRVARFPKVRGWSADDTAQRAVAEHRAWLLTELGSWTGNGSSDEGGHVLAMLFTAARAGLLLDSIREGNPELPLTVTETARRIATRSSATRAAADEALERYREFALRRTRPPAGTVSAMRKLVLELPAYAKPSDS
jgi:hypothetical protein